MRGVVGFPHVGIDGIVLACLARGPIGDTTDVATLALLIEEYLNRSVCAKRRFIYDVDVDLASALASGFDSPRLTTWAAPFPRRSRGIHEMDIFGRELA